MNATSCITQPMEVSQQPVLHIEARVKADGIVVRTDVIRDEITKWLVDHFVVLSLGQEISSFDGLKTPYVHAIDSITVTECNGGDSESGAYRLQQVELDVQAYQLRPQFDQECSQPTQHPEEPANDGDEIPKERVMALPNKELDGLWESLKFDQPIQFNLLHAVSRMVLFSARKLSKWVINWNRLVLLWGPPGTGKTSLCRGLSQKLAIRLGKLYPESKLVEINAHALGSKFFSESGKLVNKTFESIETLLEEEEDTFFCVLIDEVETLAARRERALNSNEPFDAVRAVNALLTGLDRLKSHSNVVVVCTSNLDPAFLDRVDIKQHIPHLSDRAIYEIYKECLEEMSRREIIEGVTFDVIQVDPQDPQTALRYVEQAATSLLLPSFDEMILNYQIFSNAVPKLLADAVAASVGLSGRTIRRLPALSLVMYSNRIRSDVRTAIQALQTGIASENQAKTEAL
ncbi:putative pachytene checkpoint component Pch2 [Aspergillus taichungensis]|uniref:Putative pachytene checkpoint component Pch2 n=1 Tax=Aspergillus taichungensis TaxID=482145 RepID=A0A2J5HND4_9EURO|nr:putative pachytene checkpoint component Pch2 [Aspergillus taichungensis]